VRGGDPCQGEMRRCYGPTLENRMGCTGKGEGGDSHEGQEGSFAALRMTANGNGNGNGEVQKTSRSWAETTLPE
jgi:hypothetical protein